MKKKIVAMMLAVMFCVLGITWNDFHAQAEDVVTNVDLSELMTEDSLIGYAELQTRGAYLAQGFSVINDAGGGKIGCGGSTIAAVKCKVGITSIVERQVSGSWVRVTSWTNTNASAYTISISKYLAVGSGYQYRVRSTHYAGTDTSSSYTGTLWM